MLIKGVSSDGVSIEELLNVHCVSDGERFFYFTVKLYNTTSDNFKYIYSIDIFFFIFALFKLPNAVYTFTFSVSDGLKKGFGEFPNKRKTKHVGNAFCFFSASVYTLAMLAKLRFEPFRKSKGIAS